MSNHFMGLIFHHLHRSACHSGQGGGLYNSISWLGVVLEFCLPYHGQKFYTAFLWGKKYANICWLPLVARHGVMTSMSWMSKNLVLQRLRHWLKFPLNSRAKHKTLETKPLSDRGPLFQLVFFHKQLWVLKWALFHWFRSRWVFENLWTHFLREAML